MSSRVIAPFIPFSERLAAACADFPDRVALRGESASLTYGELNALLGAFGAWLEHRKVKPGDGLAICAANSLEYALAYVAAAANGITVVPLPQSATVESLAGMIADCGATIVLADLENRGRLEGRTHAAFVPLESLIQSLDLSADFVRSPNPSPDHVFNIIYSSGTTGTPKGIVQSAAMRHAHVELGRACGYGPGSITLISTPLYSNTTLVSFLPTLALGGTALIMKRFNVDRFLELSETHRVTHAMLVPVQYRRLLEHPGFDGFDLSAYREKFCTSAPFPAELKREVLDRWPGGLTEFYGMTEGGGLCLLFAHQYPAKLHTVGQPAPDNDIRIIDEAGNELAPTETGEVVGRSGSLMVGYHNLPEATAAALWHSPDGQVFIRTGDIGRFDEDGFLILLDRKKDVIISGGFNVYPSDLEDVVMTHELVEDVAVVGVESARWGETPVAFIVAPGGSAEEIKGFANERLGKSQRLHDVRLIDRLPRNAIGKVLKRELRDSWRS